MKPRVTAVIPCHNHEEWVEDAIFSVGKQSYPNLQIVVVDDGSKDRSAHYVRNCIVSPQKERAIIRGKLIMYNTPITVLQFKDGHGPSFARNRGISYAWENTDIFAFLDADDMYEPGKIEKSVNKIMEDPSVIGGVYSDFDTLNPVTGLRLRQYKEPYCRFRLIQECIANCDSLVTKEALAYAGGFDESMRVCEDYMLWVSIAERFLICHLPESLVTIRVGDHSSTSSVPKETWEACWQKVAQRTRRSL